MLDGGGRQAENAGDLRIALAVGEPGQNLGLARTEPERDDVRGRDAKLALAQQQERPTAVAQDLNRETSAVAFSNEWPQRRDGSVYRELLAPQPVVDRRRQRTAIGP